MKEGGVFISVVIADMDVFHLDAKLAELLEYHHWDIEEVNAIGALARGAIATVHELIH